ncbi:hypothetical protein CRG98_015332 [Punica granatum]|uniref:Uncharacterized protein n=1 Tax=Punica granatum TaxID=22663 RepID=A0A2I0K6V5_PUNGR|nr:hypothetical protein CRG98_015332 [Punica granatum]
MEEISMLFSGRNPVTSFSERQSVSETKGIESGAVCASAFILQRVLEGHDRQGEMIVAPASRRGGITVVPEVVGASRSSRLSRL